MLKKERPLVLLVAGLDSGGGAGVTADCMTVYDNEAFPLPCVTALTCQSLKNITKVTNTDDETFKETLEIAHRDWEGIDAIKVGLVSKQSHLEILLDKLNTDFKGVPVVWDPVLCGTAGDLNSVDLKQSLDKILPTVTIFTPNLPEALTLAAWSKDDLEKNGVEALADVFLQKGCQSVIIKGGHNQGNDSVDFFKSDYVSFTMENPRVEGEGAHGGGCALSSCLAALLASRFALHDAAVVAKAYVYQGIVNPALKTLSSFDNTKTYRPPVGHLGLVKDLKYMPSVHQKGFPIENKAFPQCPLHMGLYPVVDSVEWIKRLVNLGVRTIQLRIKDKSDPKLYDKIVESVKFCKEHKARLFIDDYYELAIKAGAYGVHLGMEDLLEADVEKIKQSGLHLGVSTHGAYETLKALQLNPSYIALGHIFETQSKVMPSKPQGCFKLSVLQDLIKDKVPTVAIGGIKLYNVEEVLSTGVGSVALITGITKAENPDETCKKWLNLCGTGGDEIW